MKQSWPVLAKSVCSLATGFACIRKTGCPTTYLMQSLESWGESTNGFVVKPIEKKEMRFSCSSEVAEIITQGMRTNAKALAKAKKEELKADPSRGDAVAASPARYIAKLGKKVIRLEPGGMGLRTYDTRSDKPLQTYLYQNLRSWNLVQMGLKLCERQW